ncbi:hypothetical protein JOC78_001350 [Bacillus ectoiniformans]|uniref:C40 family peptidase n=1 Tax=Bacillus ectoiniformans TaxID=1494429 RepID=UPI00195637D2|nr:C40 family peptidase [Bacillus ectoiniformans]MBM7648408.1 hypothetical protein [Bacillus ectoiniformans]
MKRLFVVIFTALLFLLVPNLEASASSNYDRLVPIAKKYIGVPYKWGGTTPYGFDCSGYIGQVYKEIGVTLPRTSRQMYQTGTPVSKSQLQVGDLVFFNTSGSGISHVGIYAGNNEFIQSSSSKGVSTSTLSNTYWKSKYVGAKRVLAHYGQAGQFRDVGSSHWIYPAVSKLGQENIVVGYQSGYFRPNDFIKRADVAALLAETFNMRMNNRTPKYPDVTGPHWAVGVVNAVSTEGIFSGDSRNRFRPNDVLTRGQMAKVMVNAFNLKGSSSKEFTDVPANHWARNYIKTLDASGLTTGYPDGSFHPEDKVTRAQFVTFLYRALY